MINSCEANVLKLNECTILFCRNVSSSVSVLVGCTHYKTLWGHPVSAHEACVDRHISIWVDLRSAWKKYVMLFLWEHEMSSFQRAADLVTAYCLISGCFPSLCVCVGSEVKFLLLKQSEVSQLNGSSLGLQQNWVFSSSVIIIIIIILDCSFWYNVSETWHDLLFIRMTSDCLSSKCTDHCSTTGVIVQFWFWEQNQFLSKKMSHHWP